MLLIMRVVKSFRKIFDALSDGLKDAGAGSLESRFEIDTCHFDRRFLLGRIISGIPKSKSILKRGGFSGPRILGMRTYQAVEVIQFRHVDSDLSHVKFDAVFERQSPEVKLEI